MTQCFLFLKTAKFSDIVKLCSLKLLNQINFLFSLSQIHSHNVEHSKIKNETGLKIFKPKNLHYKTSIFLVKLPKNIL